MCSEKVGTLSTLARRELFRHQILIIAKLLFLLRVARTNLPSRKLALMQVADFFADISPRVLIAGVSRSKLV